MPTHVKFVFRLTMTRIGYEELSACKRRLMQLMPGKYSRGPPVTKAQRGLGNAAKSALLTGVCSCCLTEARASGGSDMQS